MNNPFEKFDIDIIEISRIHLRDDLKMKIRRTDVDGIVGDFNKRYMHPLVIEKSLTHPNEFNLIKGHQRLAALIKIGQREVLCWIIPSNTKADGARAGLGISNDRSALSPTQRLPGRIIEGDATAVIIKSIITPFGKVREAVVTEIDRLIARDGIPDFVIHKAISVFSKGFPPNPKFLRAICELMCFGNHQPSSGGFPTQLNGDLDPKTMERLRSLDNKNTGANFMGAFNHFMKGGGNVPGKTSAKLGENGMILAKVLSSRSKTRWEIGDVRKLDPKACRPGTLV